MPTDSPRTVPLMVFDGDCSFCRLWIAYWRKLTGSTIDYAPYQEAAERFPEVPLENFKRAVQLILPDGEVLSAAQAVARSLADVPEYGWMWWAYHHVPGFAVLAEVLYRCVAAHRSAAYHATVFFWGKDFEPPSFEVASRGFLRCLGAIYLIAFVSFGVQVSGLVGARGVLPVGNFLKAVQESYGYTPWFQVPAVFWLNSSDGFLKAMCGAGAILAVMLILGFARPLVAALLFALYLSLVSVGQTFLAFQWDLLLLEAGFLAIFLRPFLARVWLCRWLLFRLMLLSGTAKLLSGDPTWRSLTALQYHYETQPLPTRVAWYFHQLPAGFQKFSVLYMFFVELVVPFLMFAPRRIRHFAAAATIVLQTFVFITGNYAFFNLMDVALCLFLYDDVILRRFGRRTGSPPERRPGSPTKFQRAVTAVLFCSIMILSCIELMEIFSAPVPRPAAALVGRVAPFAIVNTYGLFAVMTTSRPEIIVEGSNDGQNWTEYGFKYKPVDLKRAPVWVQPHQPRLDWQMWFAAFSNYQAQPWFVNFMVRLLEGSPDVLALLSKNPFPGAPPQYVRALVYDYHFTNIAERRATGNWWKRDLKGTYFPVVSLKQR